MRLLNYELLEKMLRDNSLTPTQSHPSPPPLVLDVVSQRCCDLSTAPSTLKESIDNEEVVRNNGHGVQSPVGNCQLFHGVKPF